MDRARINRLLSQAQQRLTKGESPDAVKGLLLGSLIELGFTDPFASQIDEFLVEKSAKPDPQEKLEDKQDKEELPQVELKVESPQEEVKDKMVEEGVPEGKTPEQDAPQDKLEDKLVDEEPANAPALSADAALEAQIHEVLTRIAQEAEKRNHPVLAKRLLQVASPNGTADVLNELLYRENRILRFLELCHYVFVNPNHREAFEAIDTQKKTSTEWRDFLTLKVIEAGGVPTVDHASIAAPSPLDIQSLMKLEIALLQEDLVAYKQAQPSLSHIAQEIQNAMTLKAGTVTSLERALKAS